MYRRLTICTLAISAAVAALILAAPALAHSHRAHSASRCFTVRHPHHIRECLIPGPRGPRGLEGPAGKTGKTGATGKTGTNGKNGTNGTNGINGTNGTAHAFAIVQPKSPSEAVLVGAFNITGVSEPSEGVYCITPAAGVPVSSGIAAVSPELSYSSIKTPGLIAVNAQHTNCPSSPLEVDTYAPNGSNPTTGYAFTIVLP
jgi:hypothetical protein